MMVRFGLLMVLLSSCRTIGLDERVPMVDQGPMDQSIVFLIHGDADYVYHDSVGTALQADEEALEEALQVARRNPKAEVFIFHQRPRKKILFLFPRDDGTFYHFRGGALISEETYKRGTGVSRLDPEAAYYNQRRSTRSPHTVRMLVYLGHEIPEFDQVRYDASRRHASFRMDDFASGMASLTAETGPFDLVVLSTCYNGTPHSIGALVPFAEHVIASPDNLHLSHLDLEPLERLDVSLSQGDVPGLASMFARKAFDRLARDLQTVVTVAVYDMDRVRPYINQVAAAYDSALNLLRDVPPSRLEHVDCAKIESFLRPGMSEGVDIWYRPARFGRQTDVSSHSGWQCWQEVR